MVRNFDNIRRWSYLNFPKFKDEIASRKYFEGWIDSGIIGDFIEYFNFGKPPYSDQAYLLLKPYAQLWTRIQNEKWTNDRKMKVWRYYLLDEPELFKILHL